MIFKYKDINKEINININTTLQDLQFEILIFTKINPLNQILIFDDTTFVLKNFSEFLTEPVSVLNINYGENKIIEIKKLYSQKKIINQHQYNEDRKYIENFFKVFTNKFLLKLISSHLHYECGGCDGSKCTHIHNDEEYKAHPNRKNQFSIFKKYKKYDEILDVNWIINNGYFSLLRYKFKKNELLYNWSTRNISKLIKDINNPNNNSQDNIENLSMIKKLSETYPPLFN
ncbi:expressed protein, partial [Dictyostelium purpureum]